MAGVPEAVSKESRVTLREVTADTVRTICDLKLAEDQKSFVAPNAVSIAEAYFAKSAWFRAIYADETPVGFLMLDDRPEERQYFLWRMMIDHRYQGRGFGRRAMEALIAHVKTRPGAAALLTSVVRGKESPQPFYEGLGFIPTGKIEDGEVILRLGF